MIPVQIFRSRFGSNQDETSKFSLKLTSRIDFSVCDLSGPSHCRRLSSSHRFGEGSYCIRTSLTIGRETDTTAAFLRRRSPLEASLLEEHDAQSHSRFVSFYVNFFLIRFQSLIFVLAS